MERKSLEVKLGSGGDGHVEAVFATLGVVDHDGDVTLPGAFKEGQHVRMYLSHDTSTYMIGKGQIGTRGDKAILTGRLNLKTDLGRNVYEALKFDLEHGQPLQEWSYGYTVEDFEYSTVQGQTVRLLKALDVSEVSPVALGAGIGTMTASVKRRQLLESEKRRLLLEFLRIQAKLRGIRIPA